MSCNYSVMYDNCEQYIPVYFWEDFDNLERDAIQQAINVSCLPFAFKHVAVMPDAHKGYGVSIGTVFAAKNYILPNVAGVDLGCGMCYVPTNIEADRLDKHLTKSRSIGETLCHEFLRQIPVGFNRHEEKKDTRQSLELDEWFGRYITASVEQPEELLKEYRDSYYSLGTLGGGNHFIELQRDTETGKMAVMLHSGSRHFGYAVANYYNEYAKQLNNTWLSERPNDELNYLPLDCKIGKSYHAWMNLALEFARLNRERMMDEVEEIIDRTFNNVEFGEPINAHHNYATMENHFGENVMVHRKGAIRARDGDIGIIPGAMGSTSYIVRGLGNDDSFDSASHGAGRVMGRRAAKRKFSRSQVTKSLQESGVTLVTPSNDIRDEFASAYKNIVNVLDRESDLVEPVTELETVCVIKG